MSAALRNSAARIFFCIGVIAGSATHLGAQALPAPWTSSDVGAPAVAGSATESAGTYTVRGAGSDIWSSTDQFHFVYQAATGDVDIRAQVMHVENVHAWTKGGVMIRETLAPNSANAFGLVTPTAGLAFQRRIAAGAATMYTAGGSGAAPHWVRLVRAGNLFTSYISSDGVSWTLVGSDTIAMPATTYVGLAVTSIDTTRSAMVTFTDVTVTVTQPSDPPPSPWSSGDIGAPAVAGRASQANGTFSVAGAGTDIWNGADQFHFVYQPIDGDVEIVARINNIDDVHPWSKAGVMIREALTGPAAHAFVLGTAARGRAFQRRPASGSMSVHSSGTPAMPPGWVRLVRSADTFSGYESTDGSTWSLVGTETIPMPQAVYVGLAVTSVNEGTTSTATFTNVTVSGLSNVPPTVTLTAPVSGATYTAPANITVDASASDGDGTVTRVDFYAGAQVIGSATASPWSASWSDVAAGTYALTVVAHDNAGATTTSTAVSVTVNPPANQSPTAAISSPANGATYTAPATIAIDASAADTDGTVTRVDFYAGAQLIGSATASPWSASWSDVAAGTYSLTVVAHDNAGATTTSAPVTVTVSGAPLPPTSASLIFTPSTDHEAGVTSYSVAIYREGDPITGTPIAALDLGKPAPSNDEITSDISDIVSPLPAGSYCVVVTAWGPGGPSPSTPSAPFTR